MRIIAGKYRGRVLKMPPASITRPTADRVREALMSSLYSARGGIDDAVVLDAFAGSGAIGLEALSRGARQAWFCERDAAALKVLKHNIASLKLTAPEAVVRRMDVLKTLPIPRDSFDIVFLDPPYALDPVDVVDLLERLNQAKSLSAGALVYYEHAKSEDARVRAAFKGIQWETVVGKAYGDVAFDIFRKDD